MRELAAAGQTEGVQPWGTLGCNESDAVILRCEEKAQTNPDRYAIISTRGSDFNVTCFSEVLIMKIKLLCSILALLCFVSMYMPVIAPRYPVGDYYSAPGNVEYFFDGSYYLSNSYWNMTDYVFAHFGVIGRIILSLDQALLLIGAFMSVSGSLGKRGLWIALANLAVVGLVLIKMLTVIWACQWPVFAAAVVNMIAFVVLSANTKT